MSDPVLVALIASLTSIAVSIIAAIVSVKVNRATKKEFNGRVDELLAEARRHAHEAGKKEVLEKWNLWG